MHLKIKDIVTFKKNYINLQLQSSHDPISGFSVGQGNTKIYIIKYKLIKDVCSLL